MFLAWKEILKNKGKFFLVTLVVFMISYLVFFLTGLAYGLASSYTNGINKFDSDHIAITADSNDNVMMSYLTNSDYDSLTTDGMKAKLGLFPAVIKQADDTGLSDVYVFGIDTDSFLAPKEASSYVLTDDKAIVDSSLLDLGYKVGDFITIPNTTISWEILAFTDDATYQTAPIVYTNLSTWKEVRYESVPTEIFSAIIVSGNILSAPDNLKIYTTKDFVNTLPGYSAQVATFSLMVGFLIAITTFVLGIFTYVITIQKAAMFGVMKAQGIPNLFISSSVLAQTFIINIMGVLSGLAFTLLTAIFVKDKLPFTINWFFYGIIFAGFIICSIIGALFSVKAVLKINPLKAIG